MANPSSYTIPKDDARQYAFGWEFEGGLSEADWDRMLTNPRNGKKMNFHEFMARCLNGTQTMYDLPLGAHAEHKTWAPARKIDRTGLHQGARHGGDAEVPMTTTQPVTSADIEGPRGRSAWPANGAGGTLEWDGKTPGRYYCLAAPGHAAGGLRGLAVAPTATSGPCTAL